MNISILTTSIEHPVNAYLDKWAEKNKNHQISIVHSKEELIPGDILFLISCSEIISKLERGKFKKTLVVHASDLPHGRGWSPHVWEIINGATDITLSLLEAEDQVDTGDIWKKISVPIPKTTLFDEINELIF
jgi:methionyl-tRNA formyltransferase